jgi:hypothetical protein
VLVAGGTTARPGTAATAVLRTATATIDARATSAASTPAAIGNTVAVATPTKPARAAVVVVAHPAIIAAVATICSAIALEQAAIPRALAERAVGHDAIADAAGAAGPAAARITGVATSARIGATATAATAATVAATAALAAATRVAAATALAEQAIVQTAKK